MGERPASSLRIEAADFERDFDSLADGLREHLIPHSSAERCRWLYLENPHGRAEVVVARRADDGSIVGSGAVIPRRAWMRGVEQRVAVMADFWVHPEFRSLGPALQLQRACIARAAQIGAAFVDVPYGNMPAVYQRLRLLGTTPMASLVKPLRARPFLERRVPIPVVGTTLGILGDHALRARSATRAPRSRARVVRHDGPFDAGFDAPTRRPGPASRAIPILDSKYLEWRYRRHYKYAHDVFVAFQGDEVAGFLISLVEGTYAEIMELHPRDDVAVAADLLHAAAVHARRRGAAALSASWLADSAPASAFAAEGFRERARRAFVARHFTGGGVESAEPPAGTWMIGFGDIAY